AVAGDRPDDPVVDRTDALESRIGVVQRPVRADREVRENATDAGGDRRAAVAEGAARGIADDGGDRAGREIDRPYPAVARVRYVEQTPWLVEGQAVRVGERGLDRRPAIAGMTGEARARERTQDAGRGVEAVDAVVQAGGDIEVAARV